MDINTYATIVRYISSSILSFFVFQFLLSLINYFRHQEKDAIWHSSMCLITSFYCFFLAFGTHFITPKISNLNLIILWFIAYAAYYCYLRAIEVYFGYELVKLKFSKIFCITFCSIHALGGLIYILFDISPLFSKMPEGAATTMFNQAMHITIIPNIWAAILGSIGLGVILYSSYIIWTELNRSCLKETLLKVGICITVYGAFHDTSIALEVFGFLVPVYFLGNAFEAMRFNYYYQNRAHNKADQLESEVIRLSKIAQFGFAAGSIAHDIRNYLFVINNTLRQITSGKLKDPSTKYELLQKYVGKIDEITQLYMTIFKSKTSSSKSNVKVLAIRDEALELLEEKFKQANIDLDISECEDFDVECNQTEIAICLVNLIKNSIEEISSKPNRWIRVLTCSKERVIKVIDSGEGIQDSVIHKIFDFGFTSKSEKQGHGQGIGLAITKQILEKSGCSLAIDKSHPNTCFVISF